MASIILDRLLIEGTTHDMMIAARIALETAAIGLAAEHADVQDLEKIRKKCQRFERNSRGAALPSGCCENDQLSRSDRRSFTQYPPYHIRADNDGMGGQKIGKMGSVS